MSLSDEQRKFYENTLKVTKNEIDELEARDPGRARQGQGAARGPPERAEGGAPDVRGGVPAGSAFRTTSRKPRNPEPPSRPSLPRSRAPRRSGPDPVPGPAPAHRRARPLRGGDPRSRSEPRRASSASPDFAADLPEAAGKARVGGFTPDLERVVALAPDLVVVSRDGTDRAACEKLDGAGASGRRDVRQRRSTASSRTSRASARARRGRAAAGTLVAPLTDAHRGGRGARARAHRRPRGASPSSGRTRPSSPGRATFVGDVARARAGSRTSSRHRAGDWPRVSLETLAAWNPDLVIRPETPENAEAFRARVRATRAGASSRP